MNLEPWLFLKSDLYGWYGTEAGTICSSLLQLYSRSTRGSTCILSDGSRAEPERWPPFSDCCVEARLSSICVNWEVEGILCRPKREMQHLNLGSVATFSHCFGTTYITINYFLTFSFSIHLLKTWRWTLQKLTWRAVAQVIPVQCGSLSTGAFIWQPKIYRI